MPVRPLLWVVGVLCLAVSFAPAFAADNQPSDPLVRVLASKGILTQAEADSIGSVAPADQRSKLAQVLLDKGLISTAEYESVSAAVPSAEISGEARLQSTSLVTLDPAQAAAPSAPKPPPVIPAVAPIRVLQTEPAKVGGLVPDITLGSKAKLKLYGFLKTSVVYDTSNQQANDFPLPGFLGDTGPDADPEFHIKARAARVGANFEWPDIRPGTALTGRLEMDFEGNFTRTNNRNISSIRSSVPSIRLAWMRLDHMVSDQTSIFALFGQDWTPFGSSTLPNSLETTGLGIGFGSLYERAPQVRAGFFHKFKGTSFGLGPEVAVVLPAFANLPPFIGIQSVTVPACAALPCPATVVGVTTAAGTLGDQLGYGERQGVDSSRPEIQGRLVFQFQLDHAKGVAPAQIIFSGMQGRRTAIVTKAQVPSCTAPVASVFAGTTTPLCSDGLGGVNTNLFKAEFPTGTKVESDRWGWTAEVQLPTRYVTFLAKYYSGTDLRFYFAGQIFSTFNRTTGLTGTASPAQPGCPGSFNCAPSIDGSSIVVFGAVAPPAGSTPAAIPTVVVAPQEGPRAQGGFAELGFPLSRIFGADPTGRNAGWTLNLHYGYDQVKASQVQNFLGNTARRASSWAFGNLQYKLNQYVTFGYELGYYQTRAKSRSASAPLYEGIPQFQMHNLRSEFATIFTF